MFYSQMSCSDSHKTKCFGCHLAFVKMIKKAAGSNKERNLGGERVKVLLADENE